MSTSAASPEAISFPAYGTPSAGAYHGTSHRLVGQREVLLTIVVLAAHAVLGLLMQRSRLVGGLQGVTAIAVAFWAAYRRRPAAVAAALGYVASSDVLWRMTKAPMPYEMGKYAVAGAAAVALWRVGRAFSWKVLPLLYFAAHLPSTLVTFADSTVTSSTKMRVEMLSAFLAGPLSLCFSAWFFSQLRLRPAEFRRVVLAFSAPAIAACAVTLFSTYTATDLTFSTESNMVTSGGFGPNQVSTALGLAVMFALLCALQPRTPLGTRLVMLVVALVCGMQSAMTFSRGGLYAALGALAAGALFLLQDRRARGLIVTTSAFVLLVGGGLIFPRLNRFTGGALQTRFEDSGMTNRDVLIRDDLQIWAEHPVFGVGPGLVKHHRETGVGAGHTEYSRLLAEHGLFGLVAIGALGAMAMLAIARRGSPVERGTRVTLVAWALLSMIHAAMRLSVVGFTFGLAMVAFDSRDAPPDAAAPPYQPDGRLSSWA